MIPDQAIHLALQKHKSGHLTEAESIYRQILAQHPHHADALHLLGALAVQVGKLDVGIDLIQHAIASNPSVPTFYHNLGKAFRDRGEPTQAIAAYRHALRLKPDYADAHANLGMNLLSLGQFAEGLPEYEWRWGREDVAPPVEIFARPRWNGADLNGKTILLHAEQGMGDTLQFVRYAPMVAGRGGRVIVRCAPPLVNLLRSNPDLGQIISSAVPLPQFDVQCPLMSLPLIFGTDLQSIPAAVPYLKPATSSSIEKSSGRLHVGLVWAGNPQNPGDAARSIPLVQFAPLARVANVSFHSLQKGEGAAQQPPPGMTLIDHSTEMNDFTDTTDLIASLDLIIAVDTVVAHLAGAMAKPVWLLLRIASHWTWMRDREDSPWYPTMRLFRQEKLGDWAGVLDRVAGALAGPALSC